jgi:hypothetical protein
VSTRRAFLATVGPAIPAAPSVFAQQPSKAVPRIGYLAARSVEFEAAWLTVFRQGLRELGSIPHTSRTRAS